MDEWVDGSRLRGQAIEQRRLLYSPGFSMVLTRQPLLRTEAHSPPGSICCPRSALPSAIPPGLSVASSTTPGPCRKSFPLPPSHSPKTNTAAAREPQGLAMKNRCLLETCQPWLCGSLGSPPQEQWRSWRHCRTYSKCSAPRAQHRVLYHLMPLWQETD